MDANRQIKMVGLDLDGTLLTTQKTLTAYTRNVIKRALEQGCVVLAATGRPVNAVPKEILEFPGMKYAVTANGAKILDLEKGESIYENLLSVEIAEKVLDVFADYDAVYEIFVDGTGYTAGDGMTHLEDYFSSPSMIEYMLQTRTPVEDVKATLLHYNRPIDKAHAIFHDPGERMEARKRLEQIPGIDITSSLDRDLDAIKAGTNKGLGLVRLGEYLGIKREEIMACGDGFNDLEMLTEVGFAVAMGNAAMQLKEIADYVTDTNDDDGVAKAIERFVLK